MIENIASALEIEAHRLFVDDSMNNIHNEKAAAFFASLSPEFQQEFISDIMNALGTGIVKALKTENTPPF
jgi:hypothetical protein